MIKFLAGLSLLTLVHSWYPAECCSDRDCNPVPCEELEREEGGVRFKGMFFSKDKIKPSQDGECHACFSTLNTPYCIFLPADA